MTAAPDQDQDQDRFLRARGMRIPKHPQLTTGKVRQVLKDGQYERRECDAALAVTRPGDRVLELGAGIGYVSALLMMRRAPLTYTAYEANPDLIPFIRDLHAANGVTGVALRNALLAPDAGEAVPFYIRKSFLASSMEEGLFPNRIRRVERIERHAGQPVLDALRPDVLICDIEGAEASLIPALDWTGLRAAVFELHPKWTGQTGVRAVFDAMARAGLSYYCAQSCGAVVSFTREDAP